jgi:hypothetical protein
MYHLTATKSTEIDPMSQEIWARRVTHCQVKEKVKSCKKKDYI